jgi:type I restriction enzyme S subunit
VKPPNSLVYVEYYLESLDYKPFVTGTAQPKLNKGVCEGIRIPLPDEKFQTEIQLRLLAFEKALEAQTDNARQTRELLSSLLNQFTRIPS